MEDLCVLIVEDSEDDSELIARELNRSGYNLIVQRVETREEMCDAVDAKGWDVVIADYNLPCFSAPEALSVLRERDLDLPFIVASGSIGEETAVAAMKAGAHDYVMKDNLARLVPAVERELREAKERAARRRADETIRHMAYHDVLTGLPNRVLLYDRLTQAISTADREGDTAALLYMDLDHFKEINDTLGHHFGDVLLQKATTRLEACLRQSDTIARMGGDEFAIVLPLTHEEDAVRIAKKLLECFSPPFQLNGQSLSVGASIGVAIYPEHGDDADILVQHADVAMYMAKRNNWHYCVYESNIDPHTISRLSLVEELRQAIPGNQLVPYYQPQIDIRTRECCGYEALVRWNHPQRGLVLPESFVPLAEYFGLITPLTHIVLESVIKLTQKLRPSPKIAVNLSPRVINNPSFEEVVVERIIASGIAPECLEFEITESTMMTNPSRTMAVLTSLAKRGVSFSIDDFGTGFSSLGYLKRLPVSSIKIDKSFISGVLVDQNDQAIVKAIIGLAHNLGLCVVAEGVENQQTLDFLELLGCDKAQGFHIGYPLAVNELFDYEDAPVPVAQSSNVASP